VLVGDIIGVAGLSTRLSTGATGLQVELLASCLQFVNGVLGPSWQVNVDRCSHASTKIGGAGVDITKLGVQAEVLARFLLDRVLDSLDTVAQSLEDALDIATILHGDDAELILLVDPDKESLCVIVEDATTLRPVPLHTGNSQVSVSRDKEEMVIDQLLADRLIHASEGVVFAGKLTLELLDSAGHQLLDSNTLFLGDSRRQAKSINGASNTDSGRVNWGTSHNVSLDLGEVHVRSVSVAGADSMVFADKGLKDRGEVLVGVPVTSVDTTVLVVKLNSTGNSLSQCEARSLGLDVLQLVPLLLGDVLGNKRVLGCNEGKVSKVFLLPLLVFFPQSVDTINHLLYQFNLRVSQPVLVGDVVGESSLSTRLSTGSTGLQVELLASLLKLFDRVLGPARQVNMNRCSHAGTQISGAGVDVSELLRQTELLSRFFLDRVTNSLDTLGKPCEDTLDISTLLHGDNAELILLIDPDKEGLLLVVEDAATLWPVSLHTSNSQVPVSRDKEEMVIDQLLADRFVHASEGVVFTSQVCGEVLHSINHQFLNSNTLFLGDSRGQAKSINGASNTNSGRVDRNIRGNVSNNLGVIHV